MTGGAAMLGWSVLILADARLAQFNGRLALEIASGAARPAPVPALTIDTPDTSAIVLAGDAIAELSIPRVRLSAVVLHGSDPQTLRRGPGHLTNTAMPGQPGNTVIAGHRDTYFRPLRDVRHGDDVFVITPRQRLHYRVTSLRVVHPRDLSALAPTAETTLTLITCYPFWVFGNAPDRFVVRAVRVVTGAEAMAATDTMPPLEPFPASLQTDHPSLLELRGVPVALDDDAVVRQVVERYRLTYNARLVQEDEATAGLLTFDGCDVTIVQGGATVSCETSSRSRMGLERQVRRFTLERAGGAWAIRSIVTEGGSSRSSSGDIASESHLRRAQSLTAGSGSLTLFDGEAALIPVHHAAGDEPHIGS